MKTIVIASAHAATTSTIIGRIEPIANHLSSRYRVAVLILGTPPRSSGFEYYPVGREPFTRSPAGKQRLRGTALAANMLATASHTFRLLNRLHPDCVIISKPLPANTLGVALWHYLTVSRVPIILDTDDFELAANSLTSIAQRAVLHWAERTAARISQHIIAASPFLVDHFTYLSNRPAAIALIPTGLPATLYATPVPAPSVPRLLYIGSVSQTSGHRVDMLPAILTALHHQGQRAHLTIAGDGDDVIALKQAFAAATLTSFVTWHGRFTLEQTPELVRQASLVIDPIDASIAQRAKSSFRVLAAAAQGRPVVTSNIGIRPALLPTNLHDRCFAPPANAVRYAEACYALLTHPLTSTEQQQLQNHARQFSWDTLAPQYEKLVASLIAN